MYSIKILSYGLNKILFQHVNHMCLSKFFLHEKTCFAYNISPLNIVLMVYYLISGYKVIYHLHDPVPHKGWKFLPTYILQLAAVFIATKIVVFSSELAQKTKKHYLKTGEILIASHGYSKNLINSNINSKRTHYDFGFFGTHNPYKFDRSLKGLIYKLSSKGNVLLIGKNYPNFNLAKVFSGYMDEKKYYNYMNNTKCIVCIYRDVSFSGVIHDAVALGKQLLVNETCKNYINRNYKEYKPITNLFGLTLMGMENRDEKKSYPAWSLYVKQVFNV